MATNTYVALKSVSLGGTTTATLDLTNITGYTDLVLKVTGAFSTGNMKIIFNSDTGNNYSQTDAWGNGSGVTTVRDINLTGLYAFDNIADAMSTWSSFTANINNYSNTTAYKSVLIRSSNANKSSQMAVGTWRSTSAITSITILSGSNFATGSTVDLYGISSAVAPIAKATGGTISYGTDGYTYHTFKSSGTFTPTTSISADILVIAGGAAGGVVGIGGGGGGAGGVQGFTSQSLTATGYTVTVGAGGASSAYNVQRDGNPGINSQFGALTASIGGGGGSGWQGRNGIAGGSGGGGGGSSVGGALGGAGTAGQGYDGGNGTTSSSNSAYLAGGGGGGAGEAGQAGSGSGTSGQTARYIAGRGGNGTFAYASWAFQTNTGADGGYYAGGGGSGAMNSTNKTFSSGGFGGGGTSKGDNTTGDAAVNTGSGGACDKWNTTYPTTGAGGSGIVIVRYLS